MSAATKGENAAARKVREKIANERIREAVEEVLHVVLEEKQHENKAESGEHKAESVEDQTINVEVETALINFREHVGFLIDIASDHWLPQRMIKDLGLPNAFREKHIAKLRENITGENIEDRVLEMYDRVSQDISETIKSELKEGVSRVIG